ncbi:MAG: RING finger domain-containing protein [Candidatus Rhabdochlamydia sp.]
MATPVKASLCTVCLHPFTLPEEVKKELLVTICCYQIFHTSCFTEWFKKENSCSYCRTLIDPQKAGKPIHVIWKVFQIALAHRPSFITAFFQNKESQTASSCTDETECPICLVDYPQTGICYDEKQEGFQHQQCTEQKSAIPFSLLVAMTKALVNQEHHLAAHFR